MIAMGVLVGSVYLLGLVWAAAQALNRIRSSTDPRLIVTGAVIVGMVAAIPLTSVTSGEIGLLLWVFIALASAQPKPGRLRTSPQAVKPPAFPTHYRETLED